MRAKDIITEKCWKGYEKKGMKTMFGKRVPNCVKKESLDGISISEDGNLVFEDTVSEDLKKWFKEKWVRFGPDGKIRGACGGRSKGEGKPKCLPQSKAQGLGKKGRASSAAKKRREDPNPERKGKAKNVATKTRTMKEAPMEYDGKKSAEEKSGPNAGTAVRVGADVILRGPKEVAKDVGKEAGGRAVNKIKNAAMCALTGRADYCNPK